MDLHKQQPSLTALELHDAAEHKVLADNINEHKDAIAWGECEVPGWEGEELIVFLYDWGESDSLPIEKVSQPGPTHFLNKVKIHIFCVGDLTHHAAKRREKEAHGAAEGGCQCPASRHCFTLDERSCCSKGHSVSCSFLWRYLWIHYQVPGSHIVTWCDGAFKSHFTLHFLLSMALCSGVFWLHMFGVSGHTHSDADRAVADVGAALKGKNVFDFKGMKKAFEKAAERARNRPRKKRRTEPVCFHHCGNQDVANMEGLGKERGKRGVLEQVLSISLSMSLGPILVLWWMLGMVGS